LSVWSGPSRFELWDLERGEIPAAWPADTRGVCFRPDGKQVTLLRADGEVRVHDLPAMTESARFSVEFDIRVRFANGWMTGSGDGRRVAVLRENWRGACVFDAATGRLLCDVKIPTPRVGGSLAMDYAGSLLTFAHDRAITVYDVAEREVISRLQGHQSEGLV